MSVATPRTVEDFLDDGPSIPSVKFPTEGTVYEGAVLEQDVMQQREFNPEGIGDLKFWDDGKPMMQIVLTVQNSSGEKHRLYIKGRMMKVAKAAIRTAGLPSFVAGTEIMVEFTETLPTRAKVYTFAVAKGVAPNEVAVAEQLVETPAPAKPVTSVEEDRVALKAQVEEKAAQPVSGGLTEGQEAALRAAGLL